MFTLFGEFDCKADAKGRFLLPAGLLKQLPETEQTHFVIAEGLDGNLLLYPKQVFHAELQEVGRKNRYQATHRALLRLLSRGKPVEVDGNKRVLIPKSLLDKAGIDKDIVLLATLDRVEVWARERYDAWTHENADALPQLAEEVMGDGTATPPDSHATATQ